MNNHVGWQSYRLQMRYWGREDPWRYVPDRRSAVFDALLGQTVPSSGYYSVNRGSYHISLLFNTYFQPRTVKVLSADIQKTIMQCSDWSSDVVIVSGQIAAVVGGRAVNKVMAPTVQVIKVGWY